MNNQHSRSIFVTAALLVQLAACATTPVSELRSEITDLGDFVSDVERQATLSGAENLIVVFDIDNTLLTMEQGLGSDQWYEWQKELSEHEPCHEYVVADRLAVQGAMFFASAMRPTQEDGPALVRQVQDAGIPVIALTSRGVEFRLQTFRELRRNGYDFRRSAIGPETGWPESFIPEHGIRPARYEDGVFLTTGQHKGQMLLDLLALTDTPLPRVVLMADDKQDNLEAVIETFSALGVTVRAYRYARQDQDVAAFDPSESFRQWQELLPAMTTIQSVLGPDNYQLPANNRPDACLMGAADTDVRN